MLLISSYIILPKNNMKNKIETKNVERENYNLKERNMVMKGGMK